MTIVHPASDPRGQAAVQIVLDNKWKLFHDSEGRPSWSIPSTTRPGLFYRVTEHSCSCADLRYRPWLACKHMTALRLYQAMPPELVDEVYAF
jgi:hypothetical protein